MPDLITITANSRSGACSPDRPEARPLYGEEKAVKTKLIAISAATGIVGLGLGLGIGSVGSHTTIRTVAAPVVIRTVKVPGPVVTRTVKVPGPVRTVIKTITPTPSAPQPAQAAPPPSPSAAGNGTVQFVAYGSCDPQITYGPSGSNDNGYVGMDVKMAIPSSPPSFYAIQAQCQQDGTASVLIRINGVQISSGVANGAYNIASAEISEDPITGQWQDDNS
jgi:hypothetical protein